MRILFICNAWHTTGMPTRTVGVHPDLTHAPHQWVRAVATDKPADTDIGFDLQHDSLEAIAARYPGGEPDLAIVWEPGYQAMPRGIHAAPFPVVACYSD